MTRRTHIRALNAVSEFRASKFDSAIDTFLELDFNPAKVVALYPESVAGRLSVPPDGWIPLYGGPSSTTADDSSDKGSRERAGSSDALPASTGSIRTRLGLGVFLPSAPLTKEPETASLGGRPPQRTLHGT